MGADMWARGALGRIAHAVVQHVWNMLSRRKGRGGGATDAVAKGRTELEVVLDIKPTAGFKPLKTRRVRRGEAAVDRGRRGIADSVSLLLLLLLLWIGFRHGWAERGGSCARRLDRRVWRRVGRDLLVAGVGVEVL